MNKEIIKMLMDNDLKTLEEAYKSDIEMVDITKKCFMVYISKIFEILIKKEILTEEESLKHLKEVNKMLNEEECKDTDHCEVFISEEKTMKLEQKQGNKFKFRRID